MQIGIVGLGRMGGNIALRLMRAGHRCVVFDASVAPRDALARQGAEAASSLGDLVKRLAGEPTAVWIRSKR
jgi:6-phosphogluconate dehydrogenase